MQPFKEPSDESEEIAASQNIPEEQITDVDARREAVGSPAVDRKRSACFASAPRCLPHAGLLLFLPMLNDLAEVDRGDGPLLRQLAAGVLLGAPNLERTKLLDSSCLSFLLGPLRWRSPPALRKQLHRLQDNYEDLRARFLPACRDLRRDLGIPEDQPICVVVDRGIYGLDALETIGEEPGLSVLTWDPASAEGEGPSPQADVQSFDLVRNRNDSGDRIVTRIEAWESPLCRVPGARRVVFRTVPDESTPLKAAAVLEVGGGGLSPQEIVERMTGRWVQENDFKYQIEHFGLHELTSYTVVSYEEIAESLQDRQVPNALRRALVEQSGELKTELGKLLVSVRMDKQKLEREMALLEEFNHALQQAETTREHADLHRKATACVNGLEQVYARVRTKQERADDVDKTLDTIRKQITKLPETVSRLQSLIDKGNVRHRLETKMFFDTLKMIARNMFCLRLREFRKHYDNLRDDHVILRALTHGAGTRAGRETMLHPGVLTSQRKLGGVFSNFLEKLSEESSPHRLTENLQVIAAEHAFESAIRICEMSL